MNVATETYVKKETKLEIILNTSKNGTDREKKKTNQSACTKQYLA